MAKKSPSRRSLKSLFSRSETSLDKSAEKDASKDGGEGGRKKFKFPKLKVKSKKSSAPEKSADASQRVLSAAEHNDATEDGEAWPDSTTSDKKWSSLYSTAPRSKSKEFSYSELDLRKPNRFATFTFGLRKRKKKDEENISKSAFGLHNSGIDEQEETPLDLSQMELTETNTETVFSMSQPELDTSDQFDIPSPPPVGTNQSKSSFTIPDQSQSYLTINTQAESKELLTNGLDLLDLQEETPKAPLASIPELQLDDGQVYMPAHNNSSKSDDKSCVTATHTESISVVDDQTAPSLPASQSLIVPDTSDRTAAPVDSVCTSSGPCDNGVPQQSYTKAEISLAETASVTLSHHQPDAPDTADSTAPSGEPSLTSVDSKTDASVVESSPVPHSDDDNSDPANIHEEEDSVSGTEGSAAEAVESITAALTVSSKESTLPYSQDAVYGELYESLFPQSFTSEVMSSLLKPTHQISTEVRYMKSEPIVVKTLDECHTESNVIYSRLSSLHDFDAGRVGDTESSYTNKHYTFTPYQSSPATDLQTETDAHHRYLPSSLSSASVSVSKELNHSHTEVESDGFSFIRDSAPPVSDYVTSHGTNAQVTDSKQRVILVKEVVTDEVSVDSGCPSPVPDKMSAFHALEIKIDTTESFYAASSSGLTDGGEGPLSPAYLSVGSDDGSAMEIYYSAEEDNAEEGREGEMYTTDEREGICVVDGMKEMALGEIAEKKVSEGDERELKVVIVKMPREGANVGHEGQRKKEEADCQTEVQQQLRGQRAETQVHEMETSEFLANSDAENQEREVATTALPQIKEEGEEGGEEELPATPVQQVNTLMVCKVAPPSSEPHVQGEWSDGNQTRVLETEDPLNAEEQLPSEEIKYLPHEDIESSEYTCAASSNTREEDVITPTSGEAEEQVSLSADQRGEASEANVITDSNAVTGAVSDSAARAEVVTGTLTRSSELQSHATETQHNSALQSSEGVDTITHSRDGERTVKEQVAVEPSTSNTDAHCPDTEAAEALSERLEHPAEVQPDLNQGSLTVSEVCAPESRQTKNNQESVDKMNSGYSSLSTTLTLMNSSSTTEDESKPRFHKVSLITDNDGFSQDAVDFNKASAAVTESNGTDLESEQAWRNRFEGAFEYKPYKPEDSSFSDSLSYRMSDTHTSVSSSMLSSYSALLEAPAYTHLNTISSSAYPPSPEEHLTLGSSLSERTKVYLSQESEPAEEPEDKWRRRSLVEQEEPAAPAGEREGQREGEAESERIKLNWESQQLPVSSDSYREDDDDESRFTGLFKATLVELVCDPVAPPSTPPASPDADSPNQFDMDTLVDTLKNMGPSLRPRSMGLRAPPPVLVSSLPPIVEDAPSTADIPASLTSPVKRMEESADPAEPLNGIFTLPPDLGLRRSTPRDTRSPLELMKQNQQDQQQHSAARGLNLPLRASASSSIVMRKSSDSSPEDLKSPVLNGNGLFPSSNTGSRLDNSVIFSSYRSSSIDQTVENGKSHRPLFRASSLPEMGPSFDRSSAGLTEHSELGIGKEPVGSRFERLSFLLNSSSSSSGSLTGAEDSNARMSQPPPLGIGSPPSSNSPTHLLSPTSSIDLHRPFPTTDSPLSLYSQTQGIGMGIGTGTMGTPILQRSFSGEGTVGVQQASLFNSMHGGPQFQSKEPEPDRNLMLKYRAFPDAYLTKEKEHGKLNPRPGKIYVFDQPGMCGQRMEVRGDIIDATAWELQETISIRVVRGGWVLYEKPNFKGEKIALDEGDIELTYPFNPPEEEQLQGGQKQGEQQNGDTTDEQRETKPARRFIIGSLRRAVRDYSVPEISLFPEENAEGKKVIFRDTSDDARIFGFPIKANSIIINAGLWLVYAQPFFQGAVRVLEVGGYSNPAAWGVEQPYVASLHPLKVGEPRVENIGEPKIVIYEKPYFTGKSRTITTDMRDFMTRLDRQQAVFMYNVGSLKVLGGIWVGYEKEGFRGRQYLLEEGEFHDWRVWGGCDAELRSVRVIRADLTDPLMVMFEQPEEEREGMPEENTFEVTEAIPDVELFQYKTSTRSIQVISGAWVAYSHVDFSGNQYILEKGFYNNCADWGSQDNRICSVQPILLARATAPGDCLRARNEIILYSEPDFQGECRIFDHSQEEVSGKLLTSSCRVVGGSWVLYDNEHFSGNLYVLHEGDYPNLPSMGCPAGCTIRSVKVIPMTLTVPSISLFGLECLEGREITIEGEILSMAAEGFNNHVLSVRVNSGCWVICEHSNYRGRQFLLEPIEITNWPKFSLLHYIGSMYPVRQKRHLFRIKNTERGHFISIQGGVEEMKSGRVVVTAEAEPMSDIWFYQDGLIKNKLSPTMSLQVMGSIEQAAKVVLWTESRQPIQTWTAHMRGFITSLTFPGMVLDVKGGKNYDKDHVVIMPENEERPSQQWEIELL